MDLIPLGSLRDAVETRLATLARERAVDRLFARDASLWTADPAVREAIGQRLGWLELPETMRSVAPRLTALAAEVHERGFRHVLLCGMGGSSLCAETLGRTFGRRQDRPGEARFADVEVLDTTDPAVVADADARLDVERTLVLVASKSGTTTETLALQEHFSERLPPQSFVAITDPGTPLQELAEGLGFRAVVSSPADVGGRFSALSPFGLLPFALLGHDPQRLLDDGADMARQCRREDLAGNPAAVLGATLAEAALAGRTALTIVASPELSPLGPWIEQLVAESSGKRGRGILPVIDEPLPEPGACDDTRLFVHVTAGGDGDAARGEKLGRLAAAGHPVLRLDVGHPRSVGGAFVLWEVATALACSVLGVNAFDEPDVKAAKDATREVLAEHARTGVLSAGPPVASDQALDLHADPGLAAPEGASLREALGRHLARRRHGESVSILAFLPPAGPVPTALQEERRKLGARLLAPVTIGWGPRYLHSTGQLHKGGPDTGVFLILTRQVGHDPPLPGRTHGFATLQLAQAIGDERALAARGRRVARLHLKGELDAGLAALGHALAEALERPPQ